ncbi:MAG: ATP-dependent 6-phosphofructokinase [Myxococcota bacterium]|nr:ATP-dependent 6-phosphofructokinase [Myxococcota bacterium]
MRIGVLTGGGDAPGLNAVIRAVIKHGVGQKGWTVVGIEDSFNGLFTSPYQIREMRMQDCRGLLGRGGTVLGTTNKGDPFAWGPDKQDMSPQIPKAMQQLRLDGLVVIGGDGTQAIAHRLMTEQGIKCVGVPKTIDNDLSATDQTFGFQSAVDVATEALDRLHTTAESHDRVIILEVMGRDAGHIALHAGMAGGADCIVIPEIPYDIERICGKIDTRRALGRFFTLIIVAEGAKPAGGEAAGYKRKVGKGMVRVGGPGPALAQAIAEKRNVDVRVTVLGHLQRGGSPCAFDRILSTRLGVGAVELIEAGRWGEIAVMQNNQVVGVPIADAISTYRLVDPEGELVNAARAVGVEFGG